MTALLVVMTIVLLVAADLLVRWLRARKARSVPVTGPRGAAADLLLPSLQPKRFVLPGGLFFHPGHTWVNLLFSGQVKVGVDDFLQRLLGHVDSVTLPSVGAELKAGEPFVGVRQNGRTITLRAPVDGVVCAVNGELTRMPGQLKRDPYTRGWLVAIQPSDLASNLLHLTVGEGALAWLEAELARLREFLHQTLVRDRDALVGATAADGGLMADGLLEHLDDQAWAAFQSKFLGGSV